MFKLFYDSFLQGLTSSWATYIQHNTTGGLEVRDTFYQSIYMYSFFILIIVSLANNFIFYQYLNARFGTYYTASRYLLTMSISSCLIFALTAILGYQTFKKLACPTGSHIWMLGLINAVYGVILFFGFSLILKRRSPMGKKTPF